VLSCDQYGNCNTSSGHQFTTLTAGGGGGGGGCTPNWNCSNWSVCDVTGHQYRTCMDINECNDTTNKPEEVRNCTYEPPTLLNLTGNYTWGWPTFNGSAIYYPTRFAAVISSLMAGNLYAMLMNVVYSLTDFYYKPNYDWGILNVMFMHITIFAAIYIAIGLIIRWADILKRTSATFKFIIYFIILPLLALTMTLFLPSV